MSPPSRLRVARKVGATAFRSNYRRLAAGAQGNRVVLVENRRQKPKYLVDKEFLDELFRENESLRETLEILSDRALADYLIDLGKTLDKDVRSGRIRLYTSKEVFGKS